MLNVNPKTCVVLSSYASADMAEVKRASSGASGLKETTTGKEKEDVASLREALASARADADARADQLTAAKSKAKALIRLQQERAAATQARLERTAISQRENIAELKHRVKQLEDALTCKPNLSNTIENANSEHNAARSVATLRECILHLIPPTLSSDISVSGTPPKANADSTKLDGASEVKGANDENTTSTEDAASTATTAPIELSIADIMKLADQCRKVESTVASLADDFLAAKTAHSLAQDDGRGATRALDGARDEAKALRSKLAVAEAAVSDARMQANAAVKNSAKKMSTADAKELAELRETKLALDAKLSGMDALLVEKQTELDKVRDKARVYLKEITAEKRNVETRMKGEAAELNEKIATLEIKLENAEKNAKIQDSELDSCLALVSDKQKTIQMLSMSLSTERKAVATAEKEMAAVKSAFAKYKERARVALEERDARLQKSDTAVDVATADLQSQLKRLQAKLAEMQEDLAVAGKESANARFNMERAVRAETALELQRSSASSDSNMQEAKMNKLERQVHDIQQQAGEMQRRAEDAESRVDALTARLQTANEKLNDARSRALTQEAESEIEANKLRNRITTLEDSLHKSNKSVSAAQRVAAVAARAMATAPVHESTPISSRRDATPRSSPAVSGTISASKLNDMQRSRMSHDDGLVKFSSSSLAAVMSSHSHSIGLASPISAPHSSRDDSNEWDDGFRDQQIAVLTSQLSELSTLLDDAQDEAKARESQTDVLKAEVRHLTADLAAAQKLHDGAPFHYLRSIVVRYLETTDSRLLPVLADVLAIPKSDIERIKANASRPQRSSGGGSSPFAFLGRR